MSKSATPRVTRAVLKALLRPRCDRCRRFARELFYAEDAEAKDYPGEDGMVCLRCRIKLDEKNA